jgi:hypothetical protein
MDDRPVAGDQLEPTYLGGEAAECGTGAVRTGGDCACNRLQVNVAEIRHRKADLVEQAVELMQPHSGRHRDQTAHAVDRDRPGKLVEVQQRAVGDCCRGEAVTGADDAYPLAVGEGSLDDQRDLADIARVLDGRRRRLLVAAPVAPVSQLSSAGCHRLVGDHVRAGDALREATSECQQPPERGKDQAAEDVVVGLVELLRQRQREDDNNQPDQG